MCVCHRALRVLSRNIYVVSFPSVIGGCMKVFASTRLSVFPSPFNLFGSSACWRAANLFKSIRNTHMADIADQNSLWLWILNHDNTFIKPPKTCHGTCFDCFPVIWSSIRTCIVNLLYWKELIKTNFCFWCLSKRNHKTRLHLITLYMWLLLYLLPIIWVLVVIYHIL